MGEGLKIKVRKWRVRIEVEAQFTLQLNSLTSSFRAKQPFPLWGRVLRAPASNAPGVTSWQRSNPFFYAYEKSNKIFPGCLLRPGKKCCVQTVIIDVLIPPLFFQSILLFSFYQAEFQDTLPAHFIQYV